VSIVGVTLKEKKRRGRQYTVVGEHDGGYVVAPVEFGPNEHVTAADLATRFGAEVGDPTPADEPRGWEALAEANERGAERAARGEFDSPARTPEQRFGDVVYAGPDARRVGVKS
jgi:hypothetical protein